MALFALPTAYAALSGVSRDLNAFLSYHRISKHKLGAIFHLTNQTGQYETSCSTAIVEIAIFNRVTNNHEWLQRKEMLQ